MLIMSKSNMHNCEWIVLSPEYIFYGKLFLLADIFADVFNAMHATFVPCRCTIFGVCLFLWCHHVPYSYVHIETTTESKAEIQKYTIEKEGTALSEINSM